MKSFYFHEPICRTAKDSNRHMHLYDTEMENAISFQSTNFKQKVADPLRCCHMIRLQIAYNEY